MTRSRTSVFRTSSSEIQSLTNVYYKSPIAINTTPLLFKFLVSCPLLNDDTTRLLRELHWLKVPERVKFRLCVLTYRCLNGTAPHYLAETIHPVSSRGSRHLRSAYTSTLLVPSTRRSTLGDRLFPVAAHVHGMHYHDTSAMLLLSLPSDGN